MRRSTVALPLVILLLAAVVLTGCGQSASPTQAPAASPSAAPAVTPATPAGYENWVPPVPGMKPGEENLYFEWTAATQTRYVEGPPPMVKPVMEVIADELNKRTAGRFTLKVSWGGVMGRETEMPQMTGTGVIEMGFTPTYHDPAAFPLANLMDNWGWATGDSYIDDLLVQHIHTHPLSDATLDNLNLVYAYSTGTLTSVLILRKGLKKVEKVEDFAGLQMACNGYQQIWAKEMGMVPVTIPAPEWYEGMQKGMIDVVPMDPVVAFRTFKLHEVAGQMIDVPLGCMAMMWFINKDKWYSLPDYIRAAFMELRPLYIGYSRLDLDRYVAPAMEAWNGVGVTKLPAEEEDKAMAALQPLWQAWYDDTQKYPTGKNVDEFLKDQIAFRDMLTGKPWTIFTP